MKNYNQEIIFKELILESLKKSYENSSIFSKETLNKMTKEMYESIEFSDYINAFNNMKTKIDNLFNNNLYINLEMAYGGKTATIKTYPEMKKDKLPNSFYYKNNIGFEQRERLENNYNVNSKTKMNFFMRIDFYFSEEKNLIEYETSLNTPKAGLFEIILQDITKQYIENTIAQSDLKLLININKLLSEIDSIPSAKSTENIKLLDFLEKKEVVEFIELLALNKDIDFRETVSQIKNANEIKKVKFEK